MSNDTPRKDCIRTVDYLCSDELRPGTSLSSYNISLLSE